MFTQSLSFRWLRIRWYRRLYEAWLNSTPNSYIANSYLSKANALWDRMSELDRRFILQTETR